MSLHSSNDDVEKVERTCAQPNSDTRGDSNIELFEYPGGDNSVSSSSIVATRSVRRSISHESFHVKIWRRVTNWFVDWWMGELLAMFLSLSAFCGLVYLLLKYDGRILPTLPHNVPLSFVVSTLATVSKSSLLLVVASAFGQFKWLWISSQQPRRLQDLQDFDETSRDPLNVVKLLASRKDL